MCDCGLAAHRSNRGQRRDFQIRSTSPPRTISFGLLHADLYPFPPFAPTQSDITRLRSLVIHSLYSHKDVFLRELLSNANDALEKLRLTALTDREVMSSGEANVTIEVRLDEGGATGQLIVKGQSLEGVYER